MQRPEIAELEEPFRTANKWGAAPWPISATPLGWSGSKVRAKMIRAHAYPINELICFDVRDGVRLAVDTVASLPAP